jgi:hypothetical protein
MKYAIAMVCAAAISAGASARADKSDNPAREAGRHFQQGVELYNEGDFRGALVEFKKAYGIWPRANVLYDIGQTEYQLLDYASALRTMERYLAETGPTAAHRSEVENTVEILRGRVGKVTVTADANDCDVSVDDQPAGTTPLPQPLTVSVGARKLAIVCSGRPAQSRRVEVAAGETVRIEFKLPAPAPAALHLATNATPPIDHHALTRKAMITTWAITGVLALGTVGLGTATLIEQGRLETLKQTFPVTRDVLSNQSSLVSGLSIASDALGVVALAAGGVAAYYTIKYDREKREKRINLSWTGGGVLVNGTF